MPPMRIATAVLSLLLGTGVLAGQVAPGTVFTPGTVLGRGASSVSFSPPAGHYATAQTVSIAGPAGTTCFYTTDGSLPNIASTQYTAPLALAANTTINAVCAQILKSYTNLMASSSGWKCVTEAGGTYGALTCPASAGVAGTISNASMSFGSPAVLSASTTQTAVQNIENQILFVNSQVGAGGLATMVAEDKTFLPSHGSTYVANEEADMNVSDPTSGDSRYHSGGLQCNQQSGSLQWQIDNQQGSWQNFSPPFNFGCPLSLIFPTEIRYTMHWVNGDTGCGGLGCDFYDELTVCVNSICQTRQINQTLESYTYPWGDLLIIQDQIDLTNVTQSGANPTTSTRTIYQNNISAGVYSTLVKSSGTYTIP